METEEIIGRIKDATQKLIDCDGVLLEINANERTITHRLAIYIEELFPEWDVDCEYNRIFDQRKQIAVTKKLLNISGDETTSIADENAKTVFPDIIVHHRNFPDNLVVIEVKKTTNSTPDDKDLEKLYAYKEQIGYLLGVFIRFRTGVKDIGIERFESI